MQPIPPSSADSPGPDPSAGSAWRRLVSGRSSLTWAYAIAFVPALVVASDPIVRGCPIAVALLGFLLSYVAYILVLWPMIALLRRIGRRQ